LTVVAAPAAAAPEADAPRADDEDGGGAAVDMAVATLRDRFFGGSFEGSGPADEDDEEKDEEEEDGAGGGGGGGGGRPMVASAAAAVRSPSRFPFLKFSRNDTKSAASSAP